MGFYSMPKYFQEMPTIGKPLVAPKQENADALKEIEKDIHAKIEEVLAKGITTEEKLNERGQLSAMQRINALVDADTWCPLNSLFNPEDNKMGSANIINGLGRVNGKWVYIVASDNKKMAGTWEPGQAENLIRCSDAAKMMNIPLVYLLNCAGVDFPYQDKVYPNRRGGGTPFFRNAELNQLGIPVIVGIYGTNPAGGGYHSISPTILIAHSQANMAVGGAGILSGMNPKGYIDQEAADQIVAAQIENSKNKVPAPGSVPVHYDETGFFREVYADDYGVIDGIKKYISYLPAYNLEFFRVDEQKAPLYPAEDLYSIIPLNGKQPYDVYEVIARLFDGSQLYEYKKGYGPAWANSLFEDNAEHGFGMFLGQNAIRNALIAKVEAVAASECASEEIKAAANAYLETVNDGAKNGAAGTASGLSMLLEAAGNQIKDPINNIDKGVLEPLVKELYYELLDDPEVPNEAKGDFKIVALGANGLMFKEQVTQRRREFLQLVMASPLLQQIIKPEGVTALIRDVADGLGMETVDLVPSKTEMIEQRINAENAQQQQINAAIDQMTAAAAPGGGQVQPPKVQTPNSQQMPVQIPQGV